MGSRFGRPWVAVTFGFWSPLLAANRNRQTDNERDVQHAVYCVVFLEQKKKDTRNEKQSGLEIKGPAANTLF
jgi:hypothetical protein